MTAPSTNENRAAPSVHGNLSVAQISRSGRASSRRLGPWTPQSKTATPITTWLGWNLPGHPVTTAPAKSRAGRLEAYRAGKITLAELEGISTDELNQLAVTGHELMGQGKLEQAKKVFIGLLVLDPTDAYYYMALGAISQKSGRMDDAETYYSRCLELEPNNASALANRGEIRIGCGREEEGIQDLEAALAADPTQAEPATERARVALTLLKAAA